MMDRVDLGACRKHRLQLPPYIILDLTGCQGRVNPNDFAVRLTSINDTCTATGVYAYPLVDEVHLSLPEFDEDSDKPLASYQLLTIPWTFSTEQKSVKWWTVEMNACQWRAKIAPAIVFLSRNKNEPL
jgi:hypothetical protein